MRILEFNDAFWPSVGGIETFMLQITRHLHEEGHEVVVAARFTRHDGANPFPFPVHWRPGEARLRELVDWCDVLHLNAMHVGMLLRAVRRRKAIVTTSHDVTMICPKGVKIRPEGPCTLGAGPIVCLSCLKRSGTPRPWRKLLRPPLKSLLSALTHANVVTSPWAWQRYPLLHKHLIPLGTDLARFSPAPADDAAPGSPRLPRVIFVGRVVYEKGLQVVVEALRRCRDAGHPFELVVCGDGPYLPTIRATVEAQGFAPLVEFRGLMQGAALVTALRSADVAVVPPLCDEPFGLTAIEAMGCGLPVIAADIGSLGSIVSELGAEMVFARGNPEQLARRLQALLGDPEQRRRAGAAARRLAEEKYDATRMLHSYQELFASLRGTPRSRGGRAAPRGEDEPGCASSP